MSNVTILIFAMGIYATYLTLSAVGALRHPTWLSTIVRLPYTILHESSHALAGLFTLKGIRTIRILPSTITTKHGNDINTVGAYIPKRKSPFGIGFFNLGEVMTSFAGPFLPPMLVHSLVSYVKFNRLESIYAFALVLLVFLVLFSRERFLLLIITGIAYYYYKQSPNPELFVSNATLIIVAWVLFGMIEEFFVLGSYNDKGSDMGNITYHLIGQDRKWLNKILNFFIRAYYIIAMIGIIQTLQVNFN